MKETNDFYYTLTETGWPDDGEFKYNSILSFRTGKPLEDRNAAINYILRMKNDDLNYSYKLSLRVQYTKELEDELILVHFDGNKTIENSAFAEVLFYKYKGQLEEGDTYVIGKYVFLHGSQVLKELTIDYQFETATKAKDIALLQQLFAENGIGNANDVLVLAVFYGYLDIVKYCHQLGADLSFNDHKPIKIAIWHHKVDILSYLLNSMSDRQSVAYDMLVCAIEVSNSDILEMLFQNANYSESDIIGAIRKAQFCGEIGSLKLLVSKIKDVQEIGGVTILNACRHDNFEAAEFLIEFKPDLSGYTYDILRYSVEYGALGFIEKVFQYQQIDINKCVSLLDTAVLYGRSSIVKYLVEKGVKFDGEIVANLIKVCTEGIYDPDNFFVQAEIPNMEFLIDHVISTNPDYGPHLATFFTPALKKKYPVFAAAVELNIF